MHLQITQRRKEKSWRVITSNPAESCSQVLSVHLIVERGLLFISMSSLFGAWVRKQHWTLSLASAGKPERKFWVSSSVSCQALWLHICLSICTCPLHVVFLKCVGTWEHLSLAATLEFIWNFPLTCRDLV